MVNLPFGLRLKNGVKKSGKVANTTEPLETLNFMPFSKIVTDRRTNQRTNQPGNRHDRRIFEDEGLAFFPRILH